MEAIKINTNKATEARKLGVYVYTWHKTKQITKQ